MFKYAYRDNSCIVISRSLSTYYILTLVSGIEMDCPDTEEFNIKDFYTNWKNKSHR